jgi:hypothetical protein
MIWVLLGAGLVVSHQQMALISWLGVKSWWRVVTWAV